MDTRPYLSIIVPAYNESQRIPDTLASVHAYLSRAPYVYEIIVVDDGSRDDTARIIAAFAHHIPHLRLIANKKNRGKGSVVRQGMLSARGDVCLFMDADNATSIDQVETLIAHIDQGYDVVIGSRTIHGAELDPPEPLPRRVAGRGLNLVIQALLLPGISDTQCGFKLFTASAAEYIFSRSRVSGWGFDVEILTLARRAGYRIAEVPVRWANRAGSHVAASAGIQFLRDVIAIRWRLSQGYYPS